ncbi:acyltransferase family protein [Kluyvera sichuanensis]|uniref:acyltransferase family protein n=1 Tax=Kluyvera sichuanensis TaxID=2725494 RepID=UPI0039F45D0A
MQNQFVLLLWMFALIYLSLKAFECKKISFIEKSDDRPNNKFDALRGYLSILVVFHHYVFNYFYYTEHAWVISGYHFFNFIGPFAVSMFFILSGYLFSNIGSKTTNWWFSFFVKRIFRIAPMAIISSLLCISIIYKSDWINHGTIFLILQWMDAGLFNIRPDLFGVEHSNIINAGVTWTLMWEWRLYIALPLISILIPIKWRLHASLTISALSLALYLFWKIKLPEHDNFIFRAIFLFSTGFLCKHLSFDLIKKIAIKRSIHLIVTIMFFSTILTEKNGAIMGLILPPILFLLICNGFTIFGLLNNAGACRIGKISYSIYLIHGIIWYASFNKIIITSHLMLYSTIAFLSILIISSILSITIEHPTYNWIKTKLDRKTIK